MSGIEVNARKKASGWEKVFPTTRPHTGKNHTAWKTVIFNAIAVRLLSFS
jgi:hypothetical protein